MYRRLGIAIALFVYARTQGVSQPAAFDVASIRPAATGAGREGGNRSRIEHSPTSLTMLNVGLNECVQWAYDVPPFQVSATHLAGDSFDIRAKTETPASVRQLRMMLRDLLANRFKLTVHRESRMLPVYELVVAKGGSKLPPANGGATHPFVHSTESLPRVQNDSFVFADASLAEFAQMLSKLRGIDLPVVDHTGIAGNFDIVLTSAPSAARDADSAALLDIVQEQLGLKLVSAKAPIDVVVVDHAEKPSGN